jgi:peroxiredoxin
MDRRATAKGKAAEGQVDHLITSIRTHERHSALREGRVSQFMKWRSLDESTSEPDDRSLREQFAERKEIIRQYVSAEVLEVHARVVTELRASGISERAIKIGEKAPSFELPDHQGKLVSSTTLLQQGKLVISFIRGRWCPFCVGQLEAMDRVLPEIQQRGASLVATSPQTMQQSFFMADQHRLRFPLLSDAGNKVAKQFGLVYQVPEEQQIIYRRAFINLPFANGDPGWELPIPATYVIAPDSSVLFSSVDPDYSQRPEPQEILSQLNIGSSLPESA